MRGAILFLATFLVVVPNARLPFEAVWDESLSRIAAEYPFSYFILMCAACTWMISGLMVTLFPRPKPVRPQVLRYFQGAVADAHRH